MRPPSKTRYLCHTDFGLFFTTADYRDNYLSADMSNSCMDSSKAHRIAIQKCPAFDNSLVELPVGGFAFLQTSLVALDLRRRQSEVS